jgi:UDP-galactopyranose mutase
MWGRELEQLDTSVVKRVSVRCDDEAGYFQSDRYQFLPKEGYTALVENILGHPRISLSLNQPFDKEMVRDFDHCFNSMSIDEYYDYCFEALPYRSVRFSDRRVDWGEWEAPTAVTNLPNEERFTRMTTWRRLPGHLVSPSDAAIVTFEEPCDYRDNDLERYYPVKLQDKRYDHLYERYRTLSKRDGNLTFIGRCGTYQYLDMHQVINQSLLGAKSWHARRS